MTTILAFSDPQAIEHSLVGGKGANLGRLTTAGFPVPPGFVVTTQAHDRFLAETDLRGRIESRFAEMDGAGPDRLEGLTAGIRALIAEATVPGWLATEIAERYEALGGTGFVAVRSSGTAEDLADASFAGLHDTYLDMFGTDGVIDAVKRCWASLWTARATSYRHTKGFVHGETSIAVVVQTMAEAESAGVMFTGNPMTTATDEIVLNASWGLGESVVGGIVNPDQIVLSADDLRVLEETVQDKRVEVVRDPETGVGTVVRDVPEGRRMRRSLTDAQVTALADLGRRVQDHYEGFPQDIEWAVQGDTVHLLQSRPITGVPFTWDADLDEGVWNPDVIDDDVWSREFADQVQTGGLTPLFYSVRFGWLLYPGWNNMMTAAGLLDQTKARIWKYHKAEVYYSATYDRKWIEATTMPALRPGVMAGAWALPKSWQGEVLKAPFSWIDYLKSLARTEILYRDAYRFGAYLDEWKTNRFEDCKGKTVEEIRLLSDRELVRYTTAKLDLERECNEIFVPALVPTMRDAIGLLGLMVYSWYDGRYENAVSMLLAGTITPSATQIENTRIWHLVDRIRRSDELTALFRAHCGGEFFTAAQQSEAGRAFLEDYDSFAAEYGHRGHEDRDIYFSRRCEDASIDYRTFEMMLSDTSGIPPEERERAVRERREAVYADVVENLRRKALGAVRAEAFKALYVVAHRLILHRDNERHMPTDMICMAYKRGFWEIGRRLHERGILESPRDVVYLGYKELYRVFEGAEPRMKLMHAKIAARRKDVERRLDEKIVPPKYVQRNRYVDIDAPAEAGDGALRGTPTSPGVVTGTARVVRRLSDIGQVRSGEILIANSTDPGWTPVFLIIKGVVIETGGLLSHASCLAREYGFPAVQLDGAMSVIPDGATVTVDGNTGTVTIEDIGIADTVHVAADDTRAAEETAGS
jgi:pyruvate,water dikinase